MTIFEMLGQSSVLTVLGMGIVFGFLVIMVVCVTAMGKIIQALGVNKDAAGPASVSMAPIPAAVQTETNTVAAVIAAAVSEYQKSIQY